MIFLIGFISSIVHPLLGHVESEYIIFLFFFLLYIFSISFIYLYLYLYLSAELLLKNSHMSTYVGSSHSEIGSHFFICLPRR